MTSWKCSCCGEVHDGVPNSFGFDTPYYWGDRPRSPAPDDCFLNADYCTIEDRDHFIRGFVEIPVIGSQEKFILGVWASLSAANIEREVRLANDPERIHEPPYFGWFANRIPQYPDTLNLKCNVHSRPPGERPWIELELIDHPLAVEQRNGITHMRFLELSEQCLHDWKHPDSGV